MTTVFRGGLVPTPSERPRVRLTASLRENVAPPSVNWGSGIPVIGMHLNDTYGCCVLASDANIIQQQTWFGQGSEVTVPDDAVLTAYEVVGGFDPNAGPPGRNPTDNGAQIPDGLSYLKNPGMAGVMIAAYGEVDITAIEKMKTAIWEFGCLSVALNLPNSAITQFDNGQPWIVTTDTSLAGGHCVLICGYDAAGFLLLTWGKLWHMDWNFWSTFSSEAWAPVSLNWVNKTSGKDPDGVDLVTLGSEFNAITGQNPFPAPASSPPLAPSSSSTPPSSAPSPSGCLLALVTLLTRNRKA